MYHPSRGHDFVWRRSSGIELVQTKRLFFMGGVQKHETRYLACVRCLAFSVFSRVSR